MNDGNTAETTNFTNLEVFGNSGTLWLSEEGTGSRAVPAASGRDVLNAVDATFTGSGNSRLFLDAFLGGTGSNADELRVAATAGSTTIDLNDTNGGPGAFNPDGIVLVRTPAGASQASHFVLGSYSGNGSQNPDNSIDKGLFFYDLFFKPNTADASSGMFPGNEDQHILAGLPDGEIFQLASIPGQMQNHFHAQAGDWLSRNVDLRDEDAPKGKNWNLWARAYGSWQDRENTQAFSFLNKSYAFDVSFDQTNSGAMAGIGYTDQLGGEGKLRSGVFVGYTEFDSDFVPLKGSLASTVEGDGYSLGAYLTYTSPSWYLDAFFKGDFMNLDVNLPTLAGFPPSSDGPSANNYGFSLEGGYQHRLTSSLDGLVFGGLTYVQSRVDAINLAGATIDFSSNSSLRGRLGLGLDTVISDDKTDRFSGGVSLAVVHEFSGDNEIRVFTTGPLLTVEDEMDQTLAQVSARLEYAALDSGLTAFLKGDYEFNSNYEDVRVSVGLRFPFEAPK
jgi:outer membrane autotransporter protein